MNEYSTPESLVGPVGELEEHRKKMIAPFKILSILGWILFFLGPAIRIGLMIYYQAV